MLDNYVDPTIWLQRIECAWACEYSFCMRFSDDNFNRALDSTERMIDFPKVKYFGRLLMFNNVRRPLTFTIGDIDFKANHREAILRIGNVEYRSRLRIFRMVEDMAESLEREQV